MTDNKIILVVGNILLTKYDFHRVHFVKIYPDSQSASYSFHYEIILLY